MDGWMLLCALLGASALVVGLLSFHSYLRSNSEFIKQAWLAYKAWYKDYADYLMDRTPVERHAKTHATVAIGAFVVGLIATSSILVAIALLAAAALVPFLMLRDRALKRRIELIQQVDPALQFIANSLQVTPNVEGALLLVAQHMKPPISQEVKRVVAAFRMGQSLDDALQGMADRCNDPFVTCMVIALIVGRKTGGNISGTLRQIASTTRDSARVEKDMASKTNGQRSQFYFVVALYPICLIAMKFAMPTAWQTLTTTLQGMVALLGSGAVILFSFVWAMDILNPKNLGGSSG